MSRKEAAAEIEAGGRRKEIADETIRETACVEVARPKPPFHEEWRKAKQSRLKSRGFFVFIAKIHPVELNSTGCFHVCQKISIIELVHPKEIKENGLL